MRLVRPVAAAATFLLCATAAGKSAPEPAQEPMRFVQASLRHGYESPVVSFKIDRRFLRLSAVERFRQAYAAPDVVIDVCEYTVSGKVVTLTACVQY